jgi:MFS family permease
MGVGLQQVLWWLIVQNIGTAIFSLAAGPLADLRGNRLVLRVTLLALCGAPVLALSLSHVGASGGWYFPLVFLLVGLTPVVMRIIHNYTLEMSPPEDHPRYLGTISLCMAAPALISPLVGVLIGWCGFDIMFCVITALPLIGWVMTFGLHEPRHRVGRE